MREKYAGRARHGQQVGVGGSHILLDGVQRLRGRAILRVVVLDESHGVLAVLARFVTVAHQWPVRPVLLPQCSPVVIVGSVAHRVSEGEIEGCTLLRGGINPLAYGAGAVPAFAHRVFDAGSIVVVGHMGAAEAFDHIVAETDVAHFLHQELLVCLDHGLHIGTLVVQVAASVPVLSLVVVGAEAYTVFGGLCECLAAIIVVHNVGRQELVGGSLPCLGRESEPAVGVVVVHDYIGDGADAFRLECLYHRLQFGSRTKGRILVEVIVGVISHRAAIETFAALGHPYQ